MSDSDCLFCKIIAGEIPSEKVYEDDTTYAFRDINPKAKVHVLIVPREHYAKSPNWLPMMPISWRIWSRSRSGLPTTNSMVTTV